MLRRGYANGGGDHRIHCDPSAPPEPVQSHKCYACPTKVTVDVTKYHTCDAIWMDVAKCYLYLPHKETMDVTKFHACHANGSGDHRSTAAWARHRSQSNSRRTTPATPKWYWMSPSTMPTTQRDNRCYEVPRLPRKRRRRPPRPLRPERATGASPIL